MDRPVYAWVADLIEELAGLSPREDSYLTDGREAGWLPTLRGLTAAQATREPAPGRPSVLAQSTHMRYLVNFFLAYERGETTRPDWAASWTLPTLDAATWPEYLEALHEEMTQLLEALRSPGEWPGPRLNAAILLLSHMAYHLGALRQAAALVQADHRR